jgi:Na+/phosphate symporter
MGYRARCYRTVLFTVVILLSTCIPCRAAGDEQSNPEAQTAAQTAQLIDQLEQKASRANPREQCYLYTQIVQTIVEAAGRQMLNGDSEQAAATLKQTEHYTQLIHQTLARDTKRLKDSEKTLERSTQHIGEYLNRTSGDDHLAMQATLRQLDHVHTELLDQVFNH